MKITAVEWLEEILSNYDSKMVELFKNEFQQAKEMEKQQIVNSWFAGYLNGESKTELKSEQYYNETFTKQTRIENDNINVTNK